MSGTRSYSQRHRLALLLGAGLAALLSAALSSCSAPQGPEEGPQDLPQIELSESELVHYGDDGKPVWKLFARSVRYFKRTQQTEARGVEVRFLSQDGRVALTLEAERLVFDQRSGDLYLSGGLRAHDSEGLRFEAIDAHWEARNRVLRSDSAVHIERGDFTLMGEGFEYRPDEGELTVKGAQLKLLLRE